MTKQVMGVVLFVALVFAQSSIGKAEIPENQLPGLKVGDKAPDFQLTALDGKTVKLSKLRGNKVVLNFWTTWCPSCKKEIPALNEFFEESGSTVRILAVNLDPKSDVRRFAEENKVAFPILLDIKERLSKAYKVMAVPTTYLIDEKGFIKHKHLGEVSLDKLREFTK